MSKISLSQNDTSIVTKWTDISAWQVIRIKSPQKAPMLWVSHEQKKFFLETRLNFDWDATLGIIAGKTFQKRQSFWVTPKAGVLFGVTEESYNGLTFEANLGGIKKNFSYFSMNQIAISVEKENASFFYHFTNLQYNTKHVNVSIAYQIFQEIKKDPYLSFDIGPQISVPIKNFYLKLWYTGDAINRVQKVTIGLGYQF